jgi:hypothetical protein
MTKEEALAILSNPSTAVANSGKASLAMAALIKNAFKRPQ